MRCLKHASRREHPKTQRFILACSSNCHVHGVTSTWQGQGPNFDTTACSCRVNEAEGRPCYVAASDKRRDGAHQKLRASTGQDSRGNDARCLPSSRGLWPAGSANLTMQSSRALEPAQYQIAALGPVQDARSLQPRILSHAHRLTVTMLHAKALALVCPNSPQWPASWREASRHQMALAKNCQGN